jgi:hypothetical protein
VRADDPTIREPEDIRSSCAHKLAGVEVSDHFRAILGCLLGEDWATPRLVELVATPDGHLLGRCDGDASFRAYLGAAADLLRNATGSPLSPNSTATRLGTWWARWPRSSGR